MNKRPIKKYLFAAFVCIGIFNFLVLGAALYHFGISKRMLFSALPMPYRTWADNFFREIQDLPYFLYSFYSTNQPVYDLIIDEKDIKKMDALLPTSDQIQANNEENTEYVKAVFKYNDKKYNVKVRYRGNSSLHWFYKKKSWRISFEDPASFNGASAINLIVPFDFVDAFNTYRAEKLGLKVLKDKYAILKINGKNAGIYYQVDQWSKEFLEENGLDKNADFFTERFITGKYIYTDSVYWKKRFKENGVKIDNYAAIERLTDLITNADKKNFHDNIFKIVDKESFYDWYLHSLLVGGFHEDWTHNANLYFDGKSGKFQFFTWQTMSSDLSSMDSPYLFFNPLVTKVLESQDYVAEINKRAWDYAKDRKNLEDDLEYFDNLYKNNRVAFYKDRIKNFPNSDFDKNYKKYRSEIKSDFNFVKNYLEKTEAFAKIYVNPPQNRSNELFQMDLLIKSGADVSIQQLDATVEDSSGALKNGSVSVYYDSDGDDTFDNRDKFLASGAVDKNGKFEINTLKMNFYSNLLSPASEYSKENMKESFTLQTTKHRLFFIFNRTLKMPIKNITVQIGLKNILSEEDLKPRITHIDYSIFR